MIDRSDPLSHVAWAGTLGALLLLAVLAAAPAAAQLEFEKLEFEEQPNPALSEIPIPGPPESFGKSVIAQLNCNRLPDVAVLRGESLEVLVDPGHRNTRAALGAGVVSDVAAYPGGAGAFDAFLVVRNGEVEVWEWVGESLTLRYALASPWEQAKQILVHPLSAEYVALHVWDSSTGRIHPLRLRRDSAGVFHEFPYASWVLPGASPGPMLLTNFSGTAMPELLVGLANGLQIYNFTGTPLTFYSGYEARALVTCARTGPSSEYARVAWIHGQPGVEEDVLSVIDRQVQDPDVTLSFEGGVEVASAAAYDGASGNYLALGLSDGNALVLPDTAAGPATAYSTALGTLVPKASGLGWPVLADLEASPCNDEPQVLSFDDGLSLARIHRTSPAEVPSFLLEGMRLCDATHCAPPLLPQAHLTLSLAEGATKVRATTYAWPDWSVWVWGPPGACAEAPVLDELVTIDVPHTYSDRATVFEVAVFGGAPGQETLLDAGLFVLLPPQSGGFHPPSSGCVDATLSVNFVLIDMPTSGGGRGVVPIPRQINCPNGQNPCP